MSKTLVLFILFVIIWGFIMIKDFLGYKKSKKKKFKDIYLFTYLLIYLFVYLVFHIPFINLDSLFMLGIGATLGCFLFYMGIAAIQRREYTLFRGGAEIKGDGVKWIGWIWIIISIIWMSVGVIKW